MKVIFTKQEAEELFYNSLCNGLNYIESSYGLRLTYNPKDYADAKLSLQKSKLNDSIHVCFEDILMQILKDNNVLTLEDLEGEGDQTCSITINDVYERLPNTMFQHLADAILERDDAITADIILQTVFYNEVIFG